MLLRVDDDLDSGGSSEEVMKDILRSKVHFKILRSN